MIRKINLNMNAKDINNYCSSQTNNKHTHTSYMSTLFIVEDIFHTE